MVSGFTVRANARTIGNTRDPPCNFFAFARLFLPPRLANVEIKFARGPQHSSALRLSWPILAFLRFSASFCAFLRLSTSLHHRNRARFVRVCASLCTWPSFRTLIRFVRAIAPFLLPTEFSPLTRFFFFFYITMLLPLLSIYFSIKNGRRAFILLVIVSSESKFYSVYG